MDQSSFDVLAPRQRLADNIPGRYWLREVVGKPIERGTLTPPRYGVPALIDTANLELSDAFGAVRVEQASDLVQEFGGGVIDAPFEEVRPQVLVDESFPDNSSGADIVRGLVFNKLEALLGEASPDQAALILNGLKERAGGLAFLTEILHGLAAQRSARKVDPRITARIDNAVDAFGAASAEALAEAIAKAERRERAGETSKNIRDGREASRRASSGNSVLARLGATSLVLLSLVAIANAPRPRFEGILDDAVRSPHSEQLTPPNTEPPVQQVSPQASERVERVRVVETPTREREPLAMPTDGILLGGDSENLEGALSERTVIIGGSSFYVGDDGIWNLSTGQIERGYLEGETPDSYLAQARAAGGM